LGNNDGDKYPGYNGKALPAFIDYVAFRLNFRPKTNNELVDTQLMRRFMFDSEHREILAV
jgi:hypothetical protein